MERLWNRNYTLVMSCNTLLYFAFYLLTPLLPIYLDERFGAGKDTIGVVLSGYTIAALLSRPFSGYIVDSFNRKRVLLVCLSLFSVVFLGYVAAGTLLMFAIVRTIHGAPFGTVSVAANTVAIDVLHPTRRNEGIGFYGLSGNVAMAIAPTVGIYLHNLTQSFVLLFWIAFVLSVLSIVLASLIHIPEKELVRHRQPISLDRFFLTRAWMLAVNIGFFSFCFGVLSNYLAIYSLRELGITAGTGTYFTLISIGLILSRLQGNKGLREGRLTQNCSQGIVVSLLGYILFATSPSFYYLSAILIGLGNGHMYPAFLNMFVSIARHDERGTATSSILTAWDLGFGIGILLGGVVAEHFGYPPLFWLVALVNATGVALFFLITKDFFLKRQRKA